MSEATVAFRLGKNGKRYPAAGNSIRVARSDAEGQQSISVSTSTAASGAAVGAESAVVYSTVECFVLAAETPTATVAAGTPIPANTAIRLTDLDPTDKLAAIAASGSGTLYIRPGA